MPHKIVQEVWFRNERYLLLPGGAIVASDWAGEVGFAQLSDEGEIMRYGVQIGRISDMEFGNLVRLDVTVDLLIGICATILGDED